MGKKSFLQRREGATKRLGTVSNRAKLPQQLADYDAEAE